MGVTELSKWQATQSERPIKGEYLVGVWIRPDGSPHVGLTMRDGLRWVDDEGLEKPVPKWWAYLPDECKKFSRELLKSGVALEDPRLVSGQ